MTHNQVQWHLGQRSADIREKELDETKKTNAYNKEQNERAQAQSAATTVATIACTIIMAICLL